MLNTQRISPSKQLPQQRKKDSMYQTHKTKKMHLLEEMQNNAIIKLQRRFQFQNRRGDSADRTIHPPSTPSLQLASPSHPNTVNRALKQPVPKTSQPCRSFSTPSSRNRAPPCREKSTSHPQATLSTSFPPHPSIYSLNSWSDSPVLSPPTPGSAIKQSSCKPSPHLSCTPNPAASSPASPHPYLRFA